MGGASGAGGLLLNTKASHEDVCSRAPAAIAPGQEPELHGAGVSRFAENGSHPAATDATEGRAGQVDGPGSSGNTGIGSHLEAADFNDESGRYCGGTPHRAVQNQVFCRTGRPRRTVRYRKRPCGVREVHLSTGAARGDGSSAGRHVERMTGASGSRWRIVVAQVRRKSDAANPMRAVADKCLIMSQIMICPIWFC